MKLVIKLVPAVIAAGLMINVAHAGDGTIYFTGNLFAQTCTIKVENAVTPTAATVTLPTVSTSLLNAQGKVAGRTNFEIELSSCTGSAQTAAAFFEAGADVDPVSGQLLNRGDALNVRLQLRDNSATGGVIKVGDTSQVASTTRVPISSGSAVLPYAVEYVATGVATAGAVTSSVTYSISYQ